MEAPKGNATGVLGLQTSQDTNKLLVAILEHQTIRTKQLRDAQAINHDIYGRANAVLLNQQLTRGIESALASGRPADAGQKGTENVLQH